MPSAETSGVDNPNASALVDPQVLARLSRQALQARLPMVGSVSGLHKSPHRGSSVEFAEYRKYTPGDDLRRLDWRVYGRTDRFYIREFEADTNLRCYLVLDGSGSMNFGQPTKYELASRMVATLAYLLIQQGDAVGLRCFGEGLRTDVPPRRTPSHLQPLLQAIADLKPVGETGLVDALHDMAESVRQRALILLFSDFFCEVEPLLTALQHLRFQKHDVALFHMLDPRELDFHFDRPMRFVDMELSDSLLAEPAVIRQHYLEQVGLFLDQLYAGCSRLQIEYRRVLTGQDYEGVLAEFLVERARLKGIGV